MGRETMSGAETGDAPMPFGLRSVVGVLVLVFAVQVGLTLGAYFDLGLQSLSHVVRVYASPTALTGGSNALRVVVLDGASGRRATDARVRIAGALDPTEIVDTGESFHVAHFHAETGPLIWQAVVDAPSLGSRAVDLAAHVGDGGDWLNHPDTYSRAVSLRGPNHSVGASEGPQVVVETPDGDACTHLLNLAPNGGVVAVGLDNEIYVRLTDALGVPIPRVAVVFSDTDSSSLGTDVVLHTNSLGVARLSLVIEATETFRVTFPCGEAPGVREVEVTPSWDGMIVRPTATSYGPANQFGLLALQQRASGDWHVDVWCDDAWLSTATTRIVQGARTIGLPDLDIVPRGDGVRLCLVEGYRYMLSLDPPRSVSWFLVRDGDVSSSTAVELLRAAVAEHGGEALQAQAGPATELVLALAPPNEAELFGRWLLSSIPHPFLPWPLMVDDAPQAREEFGVRHSNVRTSLLLALIVDSLVLFLSVFGYVIPMARQQRARLRAAMDDLELDVADGDMDGVRQTNALLLVGGCILFASLLGIAVLLYYLR